MQQRNQPTVVQNLDVTICTSTDKAFKQIFFSHIGAFICWYVDYSACGLHITRLKRKNNKKLKKKMCPLSKKIALTSEYYYTCENILFFIFLLKFITCVLTRFNFPMKILFAKITFMFWILLCYLLNMLLFCNSSK